MEGKIRPKHDGKFRCHAIACQGKAAHPSDIMCRDHWEALPDEIRRAVIREYKPQQITDAFLEAAARAVEWTAKLEFGVDAPGNKFRLALRRRRAVLETDRRLMVARAQLGDIPAEALVDWPLPLAAPLECWWCHGRGPSAIAVAIAEGWRAISESEGELFGCCPECLEAARAEGIDACQQPEGID